PRAGPPAPPRPRTRSAAASPERGWVHAAAHLGAGTDARRPGAPDAPPVTRREEEAMATTEIDLERAEAFGGRMLGVMNDAMLALAVSIGHRSGLYEALAAIPPATSAEVAQAAGLQERYVREWLAAQGD